MRVAALVSKDHAYHLYQLAKELRDAGFSRIDLYFLFRLAL